MEARIKKFTYSLDLKIYEPANMYELPFRVPEEITNSSCLLKLGYHTIIMLFTAEEFEEFCDWVSVHGSTLKVVGSERLD